MTFKQIKEILSKKVVGIAGCGGLGSNAAVALARVGVGKLIIADYDVVKKENLNRQYFFLDQIGQKKCLALKKNIQRINADCIVEAHDIKLTPQSIIKIYANVDVMIEAVDKAEVKAMILTAMTQNFPDMPIIMGSGVAGWSNIHLIKEQIFDNVYIFGDNKTEASENMPPLAPRVGIVSNMQADKALEILLKN